MKAWWVKHITVLVLAGIIFFTEAGMVLYFGFRRKIMLIMHRFYLCVCVLLRAKDISAPYTVLPARAWRKKKMQECTTRRADPNWPKEYPRPHGSWPRGCLCLRTGWVLLGWWQEIQLCITCSTYSFSFLFFSFPFFSPFFPTKLPLSQPISLTFFLPQCPPPPHREQGVSQ